MCDYCGCRGLPTMSRLYAEHERLDELAGEMRRAADADDRERLEGILDEFTTLLMAHRQREESGIFARMAGYDEYAHHMTDLTDEHRLAEERVTRIRRGRGDLRAEVHALASELREHCLREELDLFPLALVALSGADWDAVIAVDEADPTPVPGPRATGSPQPRRS